MKVTFNLEFSGWKAIDINGDGQKAVVVARWHGNKDSVSSYPQTCLWDLWSGGEQRTQVEGTGILERTAEPNWVSDKEDFKLQPLCP